jgi:hypothetical protein
MSEVTDFLFRFTAEGGWQAEAHALNPCPCDLITVTEHVNKIKLRMPLVVSLVSSTLMTPPLLMKSNQTLLHHEWKQGCVHIATENTGRRAVGALCWYGMLLGHSSHF